MPSPETRPDRIKGPSVHLAWVFLIVLLVVSCSKSDQPAPESRAVVHTGVAYGGDQAQRMDVYLPAGRRTDATPLMILIHGGAWVSGDKSDFAPYIDSIQKLLPAYAIANVNYRLASTCANLFPAQENDVDSAVQFLLRHARTYGISDHFVYLGLSAGGQLALLQAYKYATPRPMAVISFFGPVDRTGLYLHSPDTAIIKYLPLLMGVPPPKIPPCIMTAVPYLT